MNGARSSSSGALGWPLALIALLAAAGAGGCSSALDTEAGPEAERPTPAERGEALFDSPALSTGPFNPYACSTCHVAGAAAEDDLLRTGAPLAGVVERPTYWGGKEIELLRSVNHCLKLFMLQDEPWTGDEPDAIAIYAYLDSLSEGQAEGATTAPAPFTIVQDPVALPDGDAAAGAALYGRACASCHGAIGTGEARLVDYAPVLPGGFLASHPSSEYTVEEQRLELVFKVRHGGFMGHPGQMPPFSTEVLSDGDVSDLLALLFRK